MILKYYTNFIQTQKTDEFNGSVIDFDTETNLVPFGEECECDYDEILALIAPVLRSKPMQSPRSPKTRKFEETIKDLNEIVQKNEKKIEELAQILREKNNEIKKLANNLSYKPQVKESPRKIEQLQQQNASLKRVERFKNWKLKQIEKIMPQNSFY